MLVFLYTLYVIIKFGVIIQKYPSLLVLPKKIEKKIAIQTMRWKFSLPTRR